MAWRTHWWLQPREEAISGARLPLALGKQGLAAAEHESIR
jgi:hypothetical protein